jgi:chromosome partitioning protein
MEVDPSSKSAREVEELWDYIADRLEKNFRRTVFAAPGGPVPHTLIQRPAPGFGRRVMGQ